MAKASTLHGVIRAIWRKFVDYWLASWWHKIWPVIVTVILLVIGAMYGVAEWYIHSQTGPQVMGVSFIPDYASYLGVNPQKTMSALEGIGVKNFRLVSYWSDIEPTQGHYDFSQLDWEMASAEKAHASVTLAIGLRQPRWPECHATNWVDTSKPASNWQPALEQFMSKVINRYKASPALASYQLENEYFNNFGQCHNYSRHRLVSEYNLVKKLDPSHPIIMSRSNNLPNVPTGQPRPDEFGISVYRRVWSPPIGRYFEYPYPPKYYSFLAGAAKIFTGRDSILHEMQAEPWPADGKSIPGTSLAEQNQTLDASRLKDRFNFAKATGIKAVYYWGAEYWYYRWQVEGDKSVWNAARQEFASQNN